MEPRFLACTACQEVGGVNLWFSPPQAFPLTMFGLCVGGGGGETFIFFNIFQIDREL